MSRVRLVILVYNVARRVDRMERFGESHSACPCETDRGIKHGAVITMAARRHSALLAHGTGRANKFGARSSSWLDNQVNLFSSEVDWAVKPIY